eukprot:975334-Prorocentrum_minimum.AAC.2
MAWEGDSDFGEANKRDPNKLVLNSKGISRLEQREIPKEHFHHKLHSIFLRGNQISTLQTFQNLSLPSLRTLDLSFNELHYTDLNHLTACPNVVHLTVSGNRLKRLDGLPVLEKLESLVASNCRLGTLTMPVFPNMTLLVVNENRLVSANTNIRACTNRRYFGGDENPRSTVCRRGVRLVRRENIPAFPASDWSIVTMFDSVCSAYTVRGV